MSDTVKLIIEIPKEVYKKAKETHDVMCDSVWMGIKYSTPLDNVKAEIQEKSVRYRGQTYDGLCIALKIIDKYIGKESEESE